MQGAAWISLVALLQTGIPGPATSGTVSPECRDRAVIPAAALLHGVSNRGCSLVGRVVRAGRAAVVVPPPGAGVSGDGLVEDGTVVGLTVVNTGSTVRAWTATSAVSAVARQAGRRASPPACKDRTFHLEPGALGWNTPMRYHANLSKAPSRYDTQTVVRQIKIANANVRKGRNTCGKPRVDTPASHYLGRTKARPHISSSPTFVTCGTYDTTNVVAFGNLPTGLVGWTCNWWVGNRHVSAFDIVMDTGPELTTDLPPTCVDQWDFQGSLTHEFGHAYALAHTGSGHDNLTMQHELTTCSTYARTLGLGDWLGMKELYGVR
jgi:hypothetical protein